MNRLFYVLAVLLTMYASIFYDVMYFRAFLVVLLALPFILYGIAHYQKKHLSVKLSLDAPSVSKCTPFTVQIMIDNSSRIPVSCLSIKLLVQNEFAPETGSIKLNGMADSQTATTIQYTVSSEYCGRLLIKPAALRIYDIFGITFCRLPQAEDVSIIVIPQIHNMDIRISDFTSTFPVNSEEYDSHQSGDDPSEIYGFREYQGGDRMNQVNWKLTMKSEDLIVKEFGYPLGHSVVLLLDLASPHSGRPSVRQTDSFIEAAASISNSLLNISCYHYVSWCCQKQDTVIRQSIKDYDDLFDMLNQLLHAESYPDSLDIADLYRSTYPYDTYASHLILNMNLHLLHNDDDRIEFQSEGLGQSLTAVSITV